MIRSIALVRRFLPVLRVRDFEFPCAVSVRHVSYHRVAWAVNPFAHSLLLEGRVVAVAIFKWVVIAIRGHQTLYFVFLSGSHGLVTSRRRERIPEFEDSGDRSLSRYTD